MKNIFFLLIFTSLLIVTSCKKKANDPEPEEKKTTGSITLEMDHVFGTEALELNRSAYYITDLDDSLKFTSFRYYVSNIRLKKSDGSYWAQSESYYLVDLDEASSLLLQVSDVPEGEYTELQYTIGVDSARNVSGAQTGALAVSNGMYWSWTTEYIFLKSEGIFRHGSDHTGTFMHHVAGYKNANNTNALRTITHDLSDESLEISADASEGPEIHIKANVATMYSGGPAAFDVVAVPTVHMVGTNAMKLADNYKNMFTIDHIHQ